MYRGTTPTKLKHTDRDYIKSFHDDVLLGAAYPTFPQEYFCDAGLTMPDQNGSGLPFGCTDETQADLATDLTGIVHDPFQLEAVTHANAQGGFGIRDSLDAARKTLQWFGGYYNIQAKGKLDAFDAFRLAQSSGIPEKRSITFGSPWFPSWEYACNKAINPSAIMPMPTEQELSAIREDINVFSWHNSKLDGWTSIEGRVVYRNKSWQGNIIGDHGFVYFPREVINTVMALPGAVAYTPTNANPLSIQTIDLTFIQTWISYIRTWCGFAY